jgi:hypothetical protein
MRFFLSLFLFAAFFFACRNQPKTAEDVPTAVQLPQDFLDFYKKFHEDSLFQTEHITWPLQGDTDEKMPDGQFQKKATTWQQESWRMQKINFNPNDYLIEYQMLGDIIIIERIRPKAANYGVERRFAKQGDGQWALIYYSDIQELK